MRLFLLGLALPLLAQPPHFMVREAIRAEWNRQPPAFTEAQKAALPPADRARLERTLARIGAPGAPALLPPELDHPTAEAWEAKAKMARTPRERFDALFFLNRFKRPDALRALDGLIPADAKTWPAPLHLEAQVATARINGGTVTPALQGFLEALQKDGKVDPVRAQAARLRLVMAGKEKALLPAIPATPGSVLAMMDALATRPASERDPLIQQLGLSDPPPLARIGLQQPAPAQRTVIESCFAARLAALTPTGLAPRDSDHFLELPLLLTATGRPPLMAAALDGLDRFSKGNLEFFFQQMPPSRFPPVLQGNLLAPLGRVDAARADALRTALLQGANSTARATAIADLPAAPADLDALTKRCWDDADFDAQQALIQSYGRWKMPPEAQEAQLRRWLTHPDWACRYEAYQALVKLDPATPWPAAPKPTATDEAILKEATRLAERGKPVRLRITFSGRRTVTLKLDPTVAPMNVANLVLLARKRFFDGHLVPRVVPDFVVQMGSPYDTMDGGPGYTVRCEDSTTWYGPGSVGMALAGKDTGGSQFFITTNATPHLTGKYTWMGQVEHPGHDLKVLDGLELGSTIVRVEVLP
jgi:cyclophilin family peptidyl-prolyl cis-trans isomerase